MSNLDEILGGMRPGDASSSWTAPVPQTGPNNPSYAVDRYDLAFAFRRASILYCGKSPTYEELAPFQKPGADANALREQLHARVTECLSDLEQPRHLCDDFKNNHKTSVIVEFGCEQVIVL